MNYLREEMMGISEASKGCQCCLASCSLNRRRKSLLASGRTPVFSNSATCKTGRSTSSLIIKAYGLMAPALAAPAGASLTLSGIVSSFSIVLGAVGLAYLLSQDQDQMQVNPECSTCEGTGRVPCVCNRWSDGDRGCSICCGSGGMACPSCHGGGTAVPIAAKVVVRSQTYHQQQ